MQWQGKLRIKNPTLNKVTKKSMTFVKKHWKCHWIKKQFEILKFSNYILCNSII